MTATPLCTQAQFAAKACPAATQVGTTTTHATAYPTPITGLAVDVPGKLYNLAPVGPEPARLGIRLTPALGDEILLQSIITVRPGDGGLDSSTDGLPRTSALGPIDINAVDITLFGKAGNPAKGFVSNPTSCAAGHDDGRRHRLRRDAGLGLGLLHADRVRQARLRPDARRRPSTPAPRTRVPRCTTVVESPAGQANARTVQITLPSRLGAAGDHAQARLPRGASSPRARARPTPRSAAPRPRRRPSPPRSRGRCPRQAGASPLPQLVIDLHGPIDLRLPVTFGFGAGGRLQSTLDGLPDTALSRFTLTLAGGPDGLLSNARDLCTGADRARRRDLHRPERRDVELVGHPADRGLPAAGPRHAQGPAQAPPGARGALRRPVGPAADVGRRAASRARCGSTASAHARRPPCSPPGARSSSRRCAWPARR